MTTLQIVLLIAGILLVLGVLFYNVFQERSIKQRYATDHAPADRAAVSDTPISPSAETQPESEPSPRQPTDGPDYMAETVLTLNLPEDFTVTPELAQQFLQVPGKHVRILWQSRGMSGWVLLTDITSIIAYMNELPAMAPSADPELKVASANQLLFCLQLADRNNVTTAEQLDAFQKQVNTIAEQLDASYTPFDATVEAERAHALDKVCAQLDLQIALTLNGKVGPMPNPQFFLAAKKQGFALERGALRYRHNGLELFRIEGHNGELLTEERLNQKAIQNPVALLDLPQVANPVLAFDELLRQVLRLTQTLSAQIMDDRQKPITEQGLNILRAEVQKATHAMRNTGIEPGSPRALRLFSS